MKSITKMDMGTSRQEHYLLPSLTLIKSSSQIFAISFRQLCDYMVLPSVLPPTTQITFLKILSQGHESIFITLPLLFSLCVKHFLGTNHYYRTDFRMNQSFIMKKDSIGLFILGLTEGL